MSQEILQILQDFSMPASIALIVVFLWQFRIPLRDWLIKKVSPDALDYATMTEIKEHIKQGENTNEMVGKIGSNHLHEISETLKRIEDKMDRINENIVYIKARVNGKNG